MMELIIVIVIAGILAAVMMPRLERDNLREATNQVVRHIQYTQHLAMVNDVYDAADVNGGGAPLWQHNRWSIDLCATGYAIERIDGSETAIDPLTKRDIDGTDNDISSSGVSALTFSGTGTDCRISFDNMGRPYRMATAALPATPTNGLVTSDFTITLTASGRTSVITVRRETGYVSSVVN